MHAGEIRVDVAVARSLIAEQFPQFANRPITLVRSTGTVNALYRLGDDLCIRLTRVPDWAEGLDRERAWLPRLAPHLTLAIPEPVAQGSPTAAYPYPWAIYRWLEGLPYADDLIRDEREAALDLTLFIRELRSVDTRGAPPGGRRPLLELDSVTRSAIAACRDLVDTPAVSALWTRLLATEPWQGRPVWIHGDLLRPNLLVRDGRLSAVIDFGGIGAGDPAFDVIPAWSVFSRPGRSVFRAALDVDDETWRRGRAYALHQALLIIPYYVETNPGFVALARRTVEQVLEDENEG
jgi:aminoglycoside phosphotransferase (APT) family kinase protein